MEFTRTYHYHMAAFWNVSETTDNTLINMELVSKDICVKANTAGMAFSQMQPFTCQVMSSLRPLKQGEKLWVKQWRVVEATSVKRKSPADESDEELAGVVTEPAAAPAAASAKGKSKGSKKGSKKGKK